VWLNPQHDKKNVHYIIVPNTEIENKKEEEIIVVMIQVVHLMNIKKKTSKHN
jgi:hypothetical protein